MSNARNEVISSAIESILSQHLDEDTCNYIQSILIDSDENENEYVLDPDTKESIQALIEGSMEEPDDELCSNFFQRLETKTNVASSQNHNHAPSATATAATAATAASVPIRKLTQSITIKDSDMNVQTFAMGLRIEDDGTSGDIKSGTITNTTLAYDDSSSKPIKSERQKRKERQKKLRQLEEEQDRQRAIQDEMLRIQSSTTTTTTTATTPNMDMGLNEESINVDVHFKNFDLHNAAFHATSNSSSTATSNKNASTDLLLSNANLTLSSHRRYGLMGRNGCGKTTLMNAIANRSLSQSSIPSNMSVLLVKQEIMGSEKTALETVLYQSNVKYEAIKQYITQLEQKLEQLDSDSITKTNSTRNKIANEDEQSRPNQRSRQRLRQRASKTGKGRNKKSLQDIQDEKQIIANQLAFAHEKLVELETTNTEEDTNNYHNPEGKARKLLSGLGFSREMQDKPTKELSGGYVMGVEYIFL